MAELNPRQRASHELSTLVEDIERKISSGVWPPGTQLPTERELEQRLGVSRNTLRKGLRRLEDAGKILRQVGRGTFVAGTFQALNRGLEPASADVTPAALQANGSLLDLLRAASPADIMEIRLVIEPSVAELAAHRASGRELARLQECFDRMQAAKDIPEYEHWDAQFHETIVASARNDLLSQLYAALTEARNSPIWAEMKRRTVTTERRAAYQDHHHGILAALLRRDAESARSEVLAHLREVRDHLLSVGR